MRRRYVRHERTGTESSTAWLVATGAIAGAAAGLYLGRRYGTLGALMDDVRGRFDALREQIAADDEADDEIEANDAVTALSAEAGDDDDLEEDLDDEFDDDIEDEADDDLDDELDDDLDDDLDDMDDDVDRPEDDPEALAVHDTPSTNGAARTAELARQRLESRVLAALEGDSSLRTRPVEIAAVGDGVVELTGAVHTIEELSRATAVARQVPGVAMVLNRISVRSAVPADAPGGTRTTPHPGGGREGPDASPA